MRGHFVAVALAAAVGLGGCATGAGLKDDQLPRGGKFGVLVTSSGALTAQHVGTTVFTNAQHAVDVEHDIGEYIGELIVSRIEGCETCEYVPLNRRVYLPPLRYHINNYDGSLIVRDPNGFGEANMAMRATLPGIADEHGLRFVLVIMESGDRDRISYTNQALAGFGLRTRSALGTRNNVSAYAAYRVLLYDHLTGLWRGADGLAVNTLATERWLEIHRDEPPSADDLSDYIAEIKAGFDNGNHLKRVMCSIGLLPDPTQSLNHNVTSRCNSWYRDR